MSPLWACSGCDTLRTHAFTCSSLATLFLAGVQANPLRSQDWSVRSGGGRRTSKAKPLWLPDGDQPGPGTDDDTKLRISKASPSESHDTELVKPRVSPPTRQVRFSIPSQRRDMEGADNV